MKVITVSREFGSGGRELGKRLADVLRFDYYDSEILSAIAENRGLDAAYVEDMLTHHEWKSRAITFGRTLSTAALSAAPVALLLEQKKVIEQIAARGKDCILVGRNADIILRDYHPLNLFVCAEPAAKIRRCRDRAPEGEQLTEKELLRRMKQIDAVRAQTRELMSDTAWGERTAYHLTVNTTGWNIKDLVPAVADFATCWFGRTT